MRMASPPPHLATRRATAAGYWETGLLLATTASVWIAVLAVVGFDGCHQVGPGRRRPRIRYIQNRASHTHSSPARTAIREASDSR